MKIQRTIDLQQFNSFGVPAIATFFAAVENQTDLEVALRFAETENLPIQVLGGGSNTLFVQDFPGLLLHVANKGVDWGDRSEGGATSIRIAAGENWHELVGSCLQKGLYGLENLALIPGTVGAAPIQNIGAYGVELADFFLDATCTTVKLENGELWVSKIASLLIVTVYSKVTDSVDTSYLTFALNWRHSGCRI